MNKQDLPARLDTAALLQLVDADEIIKTAIPTSDGMDALDERIAKLFFGGIENSQGTVMVSNARQIGLLRQASKSLDAVMAGIHAGMPIDLV
ncbi:tRNA uridine-5-carboxymethylaminomethyl(34) synthesis GTPase MnmE, partial [Paenibacillus polymyxa]|nr:tRNA uridine-5-carboxymethylaminomethyl(34) synthesis GTPase MnmE [Paenibacillus polymyxa]